MKEIIEQLRKLDACKEGLDWLTEQPNPQTAWETCENGADLLWLCARLSGAPKSSTRLKLVRVLNECIGVFVRLTADNTYAATAATAAAANAATAAAANAANAAVNAAAYAATAVQATDAADDADAVASLRKQADIVRKHYSFDEILNQLKNVR
jgi:hypothetical protein